MITEFDGTPLQSESTLPELLNKRKPGETVTLTVIRGTQTMTLQLTLGEMPS